MNNAISFFDAGAEGFYHGMTLGLVALMDDHYRIKSNRESGDGRYDISLIPRERKYPGIILEIKWKKGITEQDLDALADEALAQINAKGYASEMRSDDIEQIVKLGIAFSGKKISIKAE